jgi:hypothetical protein
MSLGEHPCSARARALAALSRLGVLPDEPARQNKVLDRLELFLWHFARLRWYQIHEFFFSIEPVEAMSLVQSKFAPGKVLEFFSERQDDSEWENSLTVALSLLFAAMRQSQKRGYGTSLSSIFVLQRMLEQVLEEVTDLEDLLRIGTPP